MKNYDFELTIFLDRHGAQQARALQAKTGANRSKLLLMKDGENHLISNDGSPSMESFTDSSSIRINFIGHGNPKSTVVSDTAGTRRWTPAELEKDIRAAIEWALPGRSKRMMQRLSMIVCYGGGHTYTTQNEYGHIIHPRDSFGYKFFERARRWVVDMTARGDVSVTRMFMVDGAPEDTTLPQYFLGAEKRIGADGAHKDKYRKVRFYTQGDEIKVEWPYRGYG